MAAPFRVRAIAATCLVAVGATTLHGNTSSASCCLCQGSGKKGTEREEKEEEEEEKKVHITHTSYTSLYTCGAGCVRFYGSEECNHDALVGAIHRQMMEAANPCQKVGKCDILAGPPGEAGTEKDTLKDFLNGWMEKDADGLEFKDEVQKKLRLGLDHSQELTYTEKYYHGQWRVFVRCFSPLLFRDGLFRDGQTTYPGWKTYLDMNVATVAKRCAEADDVMDFWKEITKKATEAWDGADEGCAPELGLTRPNKLALWERDFTNDGKDQQPWLAEMQKLGVVVQEEEIKEETPEEKKEREEKAKAQRAEKSARAQEWANKQNDKAKELENKNADPPLAHGEYIKKELTRAKVNKEERRKEVMKSTDDLTEKKRKKHHGCSIIRSLVKKIAAIAARH